jgi:hypothetical protein
MKHKLFKSSEIIALIEDYAGKEMLLRAIQKHPPFRMQLMKEGLGDVNMVEIPDVIDKDEVLVMLLKDPAIVEELRRRGLCCSDRECYECEEATSSVNSEVAAKVRIIDMWNDIVKRISKVIRFRG